jgi:hypothetical protein
MPAATDENLTGFEAVEARISMDLPKRDEAVSALKEVYQEKNGERVTDFGDYERADLDAVVEYVNTKLVGLKEDPDGQNDESSRLRQNIEELEDLITQDIADLDAAEKFGGGPREKDVDEHDETNKEAATLRAEYHVFKAVYGE